MKPKVKKMLCCLFLSNLRQNWKLQFNNKNMTNDDDV